MQRSEIDQHELYGGSEELEVPKSRDATVMRQSLNRISPVYLRFRNLFVVMSGTLLTSHEAADQLGISVASLYDWLARSNRGEFFLRGQPFSINYYQGGSQGQGRIKLETAEIERLKEAMRVRPKSQLQRRLPMRLQQFPGITVPLGRPKN